MKVKYKKTMIHKEMLEKFGIIYSEMIRLNRLACECECDLITLECDIMREDLDHMKRAIDEDKANINMGNLNFEFLKTVCSKKMLKKLGKQVSTK